MRVENKVRSGNLQTPPEHESGKVLLISHIHAGRRAQLKIALKVYDRIHKGLGTRDQAVEERHRMSRMTLRYGVSVKTLNTKRDLFHMF